MKRLMLIYGARTREVIAAEVEAGIRILDMLDGCQDLEPEPAEDIGDAEPEGDCWLGFDGEVA